MKINILAICGIKNAGKTTLIERVLPFLRRKNIRVGVIKHDGHSYQADVPGTDSFRFWNAQADAVAVYDAEKFTITRRETISVDSILSAFSDMDLILVEGWKSTPCAKMEIVRRAVSCKPASNPENRLALISDCFTETSTPVFHPEDIENISRFILSAYREKRWAVDIDQICNPGGTEQAGKQDEDNFY